MSVGSISNSSFKECKSEVIGGGIFAEIDSGSKLSIDGQCQFIDCYAVNGGGLYARIYSSSSLLRLEDCLFKGCQSYSAGGGMLIDCENYGVAKLNKVIFENCSSSNGGGGIFLDMSSPTQQVINGLTFSSCSASYYGGGIYLEYNNNSTLEFINTTFFNCSAYNGGGIYYICYFKNNILEITSNNLIFKECKATYGGGIYIGQYINYNNNRFGGGIFLAGEGDYDPSSNDLDFRGLKIYNNSASNGGQSLYLVMTKLQEWCQYGIKGEYVKGNYSDSTSYLCELEGIPINFTTFNFSPIEQIKQQQKQLEQFWNEDIDENKFNCPFPIDCTDLTGKTEQECECIEDDPRIDICPPPIDCTDVIGKTKQECECIENDPRIDICTVPIDCTDVTGKTEQECECIENDPRIDICTVPIDCTDVIGKTEQECECIENDPRIDICTVPIDCTDVTGKTEQDCACIENDPRDDCKKDQDKDDFEQDLTQKSNFPKWIIFLIVSVSLALILIIIIFNRMERLGKGAFGEDAWAMITELACAVYQLHSTRRIHGDLKCENVLLTNELKIKLADLALTRQLQFGKDYTTMQVGTILYQSPELLKRSNEGERSKIIQTQAADIWAMGVICYEILAQKHPFVNNKDNVTLDDLIKIITESNPQELPFQYSDRIKNLIMKMLIKYPVSKGDKDNNWLPSSLLISSLYCDTIVAPIRSVREQKSDLWGGHFSKISKNSIKPEPSELGLVVNFDPPMFTAKTPVATAVEQPEMGDEIGKFLQAELQPTLQDIERQLTPRQAVSERTQALMAKILEATTGVQASEIDFWATNILDEQNGEARRRQIQCPQLLPITSVPVSDEVLDSKRSPIDKILQREQALELYNFRIGQGMLAHLSRENAFCKSTERERNQRKLFQFSCEFKQLALKQRSRIAHAGSAGHCKERHSEQRCDRNHEFVVRNSIAAKEGVKTKKFRQLTPSAIWNQIKRPVLNQNESQAFELNQEAQIARTQNDMSPPNAGPRDWSPPDHGLCTQRNAVIPQSTIFPPALNAEQEIPGIPNELTKETIKDQMRRWMLKGFDLILVGKDDEGQCWPGFGPDVPHATDQRQSKQQGQTPSIDAVRSFCRELNFDLRVACVRKEYDSEDDSETLQPAKTIIQEFKTRFGRHRNRSLSPHSKRSRYDPPDRRSESRERSGSRSYSRSTDYQSPRETRMDVDRNHNGFETRNESRGRGRGSYRGRGYSYQGRIQSYQDRDQSNQEERYREAQKYDPCTMQVFNKTKNPINRNRTHQFENRNREEGWDGNPNDDWTKRTQMQKDLENYSD
ncbi:MAG: hypothetical protein EZS28_001556 [Streblomastix strix]|uniref:non-specific serine/threonine protein kinase n=1 Tax=Streblomastix strix TaxID=222440 RepID=A0A5J4X8H4_9EUKA|nr:MAG: hypothetical protein EZS28_001556 [Streblomastix strix]